MNFFKNPFPGPIGTARAGCEDICGAICEATNADETGSATGDSASSGKSI